MGKTLNEKNKKILFAAIAVAAIILIIGAVMFSRGGNSEKAKTSTGLSVDYKDGSNIVVKGVKDGWTTTKEFTIENKSGKDATYDLVWDKASNTYITQSDLLYSIESEGVGASKLGTSQIPVAASPIFTAVKIEDDVKHTYKIKVWYKKSGTKDESNSEFNGTLKVKANK